MLNSNISAICFHDSTRWTSHIQFRRYSLDQIPTEKLASKTTKRKNEVEAKEDTGLGDAPWSIIHIIIEPSTGTSKPPPLPAGGDMRSNLMEAIRKAGGAETLKSSARVKHTQAVKEQQEEKAPKQAASSGGGGGDLMALQ